MLVASSITSICGSEFHRLIVHWVLLSVLNPRLSNFIGWPIVQVLWESREEKFFLFFTISAVEVWCGEEGQGPVLGQLLSAYCAAHLRLTGIAAVPQWRWEVRFLHIPIYGQREAELKSSASCPMLSSSAPAVLPSHKPQQAAHASWEVEDSGKAPMRASKGVRVDVW